jgi:chaperone required for assembly of F1-ATPase
MTSKNGGSKRDHRGDLHRAAAGAPPPRLTDSLTKPLARRFYKEVTVTGDAAPFRVLLDGRPAKTPKKRVLELPTKALAMAVAEEWRAQGERIDPSRMPLTRFANTAIDAVAEALEPVARDITGYAGSDLLCYRAEGPETLVRLQAKHWDPVLRWAGNVLGVQFKIGLGVMPVAQPESVLTAVAAALTPHDAFRLTGLHVLTTLTGSALLALALVRGEVTADAAWAAAHVDEDYQISLWGEDYEAAARRRARRREFDAACALLCLLA